MSVSSAMYAAITGLNAMGTAMSVISNNIANVNTVGFKGSRANFADLLSQSSHSASGAQQIGRGVRLGSVTQIFSQGSFQNSAQDTDIAIAGEGFFAVRDPITNEEFYTRAGNFIFDQDGKMVSPSGYILQGWELDDTNAPDPPIRVGTPQDVIMAQFNAPPELTTMAHYVANLDSREESRYNGPPFSNAWDGSDPQTPIEGRNFVYQTALRVYDGLGDGHDLSVYFDPHDTLDNVWDYIVAVNPEEDKRVDALGNSISGSTFAGLLQRGSITFSTESTGGTGGQIVDITADNLTGFTVSQIGAVSSASVTTTGTYSGASARTYTCTWVTSGAGSVSSPPYPQMKWIDNDVPPNSATTTLAGLGPHALTEGINITFASSAVTSGAAFTIGPTTPSTETWTSAVPNSDGYFEFTASFLTSATPVVPTDQTIAVNFGASNPNGANPTWILDSDATTQYAAPSTTIFQTQDGFASGYLQRISIDNDGIITGTYSNGRNQKVFQIGLQLFRNQWGLEKVGNNLYRKSLDSGDGTINPAGTGGTGTIAPNSLEQSNVDLADEFVDMIIQQRGFQANSKVITTTDTMLAELISLKR